MSRLRRLSTVVMAAVSVCLACSHETPAPARDAAPSVAARPDAGRTARRRRRRPRAQSRQAGAHASNTPTAQAGDPPAEVDDYGDEPPRPRTMPETGPTISEDLGPPPAQSFDMAQGASEGPMGMDPQAVSRGLNPLLPRFSACAAFATDDQGHGPHGRVTVRLRIRNDGQPLAARVSGGGGTSDFVLCVRRVVASARFSRFNGPDAMASWGFDVDG